MPNYYSKLTISSYKDKNGKQIGWRGSLSWRDAEGNRKQTTKVCRTKLKRDARAYLEEWQKELESQARVTPQMPQHTKNMPTVTEAITTYVNYQLSIGEIEQSTHAKDISDIKKYIAPYIGDYIFTAIDTNVLNGWLAKLYERGLSEHTIKNAFATLRKSYNYYYRTRKIKENPCEFVKSPKRGKAKIGYLEPGQIQHLLESLDAETDKGDYFRTSVLIALYSGLRREEVCGLRWYDVDFEANLISVSTAIGIVKRFTATPKSLKHKHPGDSSQ